MVSKTIKRTPIKSIKDCRNSRNRHRKRSPIKKAAAGTSSAVLAAINKSFFTCQRRLVKIFTKLARIGTPNHRRKGYKMFRNDQDSDLATLRRSLFSENPLPPLLSLEKKTVFLDLDETLIHSKADPPPENFDFVVKPVIDGEKMSFYVLKRPGVDKFLQELSERFEIVIFTAGLKEYASLVLDEIDRKGAISHRLYRDSCREMDGKFVKDLGSLGRDLKNVVIVDDNPNAYELQPENAIPIRPFIDDLEDKELGKLVQFFEKFDCFDDVRDAVKLYVAELDDTSF